MRVKPLEWIHHDGAYPIWRASGLAFDAKIDKGAALRLGKFPLFINGFWDGKKHQTLQSAQAAAWNRYEARILSAIEVDRVKGKGDEHE